jgi:hypothetical protein
MKTISQRVGRSIHSHVIHHAVVGAILCLAAPSSQAATIYDLGSLGANYSERTAVNDAGLYVRPKKR